MTFRTHWRYIFLSKVMNLHERCPLFKLFFNFIAKLVKICHLMLNKRANPVFETSVAGAKIMHVCQFWCFFQFKPLKWHKTTVMISLRQNFCIILPILEFFSSVRRHAYVTCLVLVGDACLENPFRVSAPFLKITLRLRRHLPQEQTNHRPSQASSAVEC